MKVTMVQDADALRTVCERIEKLPRVGFDTEFHSEKTYVPRLMLAQIALEDEVAIVDPLAVADLRPLAAALRGRTVVGHALSSDLKIFFERYALLPTEVFDTQVAGAFCGYGLAVSLVELVRDITGVTLRKSQTVSDWSTRPLSARQIDYLVEDVKYLLELHDQLLKKLDARGRRSWAFDECALLLDHKKYAVDRNRLYQRVAGAQRLGRRELAILSELATLREAVARERDVPLKTVLSDDLLVALAQMRPKSVDDLEELRRLTPSMKRTLGGRIVAAVAAGEGWPEDGLPTKGGKPLGAAREACVALLGVLVDGIAAAAGLPSSLVAPRAVLERALRELLRSQEELIEVLDLTHWRADLVAGPMWALLSGGSTVRVQGYLGGAPRATISTASEESGGRLVENDVQHEQSPPE